jgi:hypothetical protein
MTASPELARPTLWPESWRPGVDLGREIKWCSDDAENRTVKRIAVATIAMSLAVASCAELGSNPDSVAYPDAPPYSGRDLDCVDIGHRVQVSGGDPHRLDGDGDGVGCEDW